MSKPAEPRVCPECGSELKCSNRNISGWPKVFCTNRNCSYSTDPYPTSSEAWQAHRNRVANNPAAPQQPDAGKDACAEVEKAIEATVAKINEWHLRDLPEFDHKPNLDELRGYLRDLSVLKNMLSVKVEVDQLCESICQWWMKLTSSSRDCIGSMHVYDAAQCAIRDFAAKVKGE